MANSRKLEERDRGVNSGYTGSRLKNKARIRKIATDSKCHKLSCAYRFTDPPLMQVHWPAACVNACWPTTHVARLWSPVVGHGPGVGTSVLEVAFNMLEMSRGCNLPVLLSRNCWWPILTTGQFCNMGTPCAIGFL